MNNKSILKRLYKNKKKVGVSHGIEMLFMIIQLKSLNKDLIQYKRPLYLDVKEFISSYIISVERKDFGYDQLNISKLIQVIEYVDDVQEKSALSIFVIRHLNTNSLEDELSDFNIYYNTVKTQFLKSQSKFSFKLKLLSHLCSYNIKTIMIIGLFGFILAYIIFLPAQFEIFEIFKINYKDYSHHYYWNHFLNIVSSLLDLEETKIIQPINTAGVILLSFLKLTYITFIVNFLYQKTLKIIYAN
ncbi:hypothetical protein [Patiriisocius marinus]|uniref:hypothetical protein n=1 Tax=Patiriisocius marinus TaxID=1397112 RepID=UPI00232F1AEC|nr:hypothetical protein [Patiriisocius marinus]